MSKIVELTPEQESKFEEFVEKWTAIGLSTKAPDEEKVRELIPAYYQAGELPPPEEVYFCKSFLEVFELGSKLIDKGSKKVTLEYIWSARVGMSFWAGWKSRIDYMKDIGVDISEYEPTLELAKECCYLFPFDNAVFIVQNPTEIYLNQNGDLHHESAMAIKWADGFGMYCLNGVRMDGAEWFFEKKLSDEDKARKIFATENVEQRAEMLRVFGMNKIYERLPHKKISERADGYEVLAIDIGTGRMEEALKMVNPSTGEIHVEFVDRGVKTVEKALMSRWPERMRTKYNYSEAKARA